MAKSDPQSKRKRTWGEFLFGGEEQAIKHAEYKRDMGINPAAKRLQSVEAAYSYKAMDNPTSKPARSEASSGRLPDAKEDKLKGPRSTAGTYTKSYDVKPETIKRDPAKPTPIKKTPVKKAPKATKPIGAVKKTFAKPGKMNPFERQKAQRLEKEGWGGRSMTTEKAKARVMQERGYSLPKMPSLGKSKPKKSVKQGSTSSFGMKMQGQKKSSSGTKSFRFKDLFK